MYAMTSNAYVTMRRRVYVENYVSTPFVPYVSTLEHVLAMARTDAVLATNIRAIVAGKTVAAVPKLTTYAPPSPVVFAPAPRVTYAPIDVTPTSEDMKPATAPPAELRLHGKYTTNLQTLNGTKALGVLFNDYKELLEEAAKLVSADSSTIRLLGNEKELYAHSDLSALNWVHVVRRPSHVAATIPASNSSARVTVALTSEDSKPALPSPPVDLRASTSRKELSKVQESTPAALPLTTGNVHVTVIGGGTKPRYITDVPIASIHNNADLYEAVDAQMHCRARIISEGEIAPRDGTSLVSNLALQKLQAVCEPLQLATTAALAPLVDTTARPNGTVLFSKIVRDNIASNVTYTNDADWAQALVRSFDNEANTETMPLQTYENLYEYLFGKYADLIEFRVYASPTPATKSTDFMPFQLDTPLSNEERYAVVLYFGGVNPPYGNPTPVTPRTDTLEEHLRTENYRVQNVPGKNFECLYNSLALALGGKVAGATVKTWVIAQHKYALEAVYTKLRLAATAAGQQSVADAKKIFNKAIVDNNTSIFNSPQWVLWKAALNEYETLKRSLSNDGEETPEQYIERTNKPYVMGGQPEVHALVDYMNRTTSSEKYCSEVQSAYDYAAGRIYIQTYPRARTTCPNVLRVYFTPGHYQAILPIVAPAAPERRAQSLESGLRLTLTSQTSAGIARYPVDLASNDNSENLYAKLETALNGAQGSKTIRIIFNGKEIPRTGSSLSGIVTGSELHFVLT
jgi:hypothetical protein